MWQVSTQHRVTLSGLSIQEYKRMESANELSTYYNMGYEIPQELEYQEKIMFGLTFKQLAYASLFLPIVVYIVLKTPLNIAYKVALALIPSAIACVFMFTAIPKKSMNWFRWLFHRKYELMDKKMKDFLNLSKIEGDVIQLKARRLAIIKVEPINFSIRNTEEKSTVISAFQKFLNSLDFQIQIVIATDCLNLDYYLNLLEQRVDELIKKSNDKSYQQSFDNYKTFLHNLINSRNLLNRSFYLVIPEKHDIGLAIQVGVCEELLKNIDLKFKVLKDEELTDCLSSFFNDLYSDDDKRSLVEEIPTADYLHYTIAPKFMINNKDSVQIGDKLTRVIIVKGYPRSVEEGFLDKIITLNGDFDLAIHIEPYQIETMMVNLNKELQKQRADLWAIQNKSIINPSLEIKYNDTKAVLENLQKGSEKLFNVSLYITCKGKSSDELNLLSKKMESELNALMMIPALPVYEMHKALKSTIPLAENALNIKRNITTKALSAFFPFTSQFLEIDETGIWLGLNKNNVPIIKDIFKLYNANGVILASSGGGKSYFTKLMIIRLLLNGTKVMVIDPQSEYVDLVNKFNGQLITISRTSETIINPFDLMGHDYDEKKLTLFDLFPLMIGETSEIQKAVLDRALTTVYNDKGITKDKETWKLEPPMMQDLLLELKKMSRNATKIERETYRSLINRIEMYVSGVFSFLNKQTNINFNNRFVCFNIGDMPNQVKPVIMFLILDYVYMKMKKDKERKLLVIDEAWSLLERSEDEGYIFKIVKTCRKFNLGLLLITQDVADLLRNDAGKALLNNSEYTLLLRQKQSIMESVEKTFNLSQKEKEVLLTAASGEGIIIISNEHSEIKVIASPEEHELITTNADELLKREIDNANEVVTKFEKPAIDYSKYFFKKSELTKAQADDLVKRGYTIGSFIGLFGGRREEYLLKPKNHESPEHFFVIKLIEQYIRKFTDKIELFESVRPDIIFIAGNKKIAVEVETGTSYDKDHERLLKKVEFNNKVYGKDWFFVIINAHNIKEKYGKLARSYSRREVPAIIKEYFAGFDAADFQQSNSGDKQAIAHENSQTSSQNPPGMIVKKTCNEQGGLRNMQENQEPKQLSTQRIEQLNKQPIIETQIALSEDRKWLIHKTIMTDIKPVSYFEKVFSTK